MCASRSSPHLNARRVNDSQPVKATRRIDICLWYIYTDTCKSRHDVIGLFFLFFFFLGLKKRRLKVTSQFVGTRPTGERTTGRVREVYDEFLFLTFFCFFLLSTQYRSQCLLALYYIGYLFYFFLFFLSRLLSLFRFLTQRILNHAAGDNGTLAGDPLAIDFTARQPNSSTY